MKGKPTSLAIDTQLSAQEARRLSRFLQSATVPTQTMSLNQLKGFLFCISTTPDAVNPSQWLPAVFGGQLPEMRTEADAWPIHAIMRLYNQIHSQVLAGNPRLPDRCRLDSQAMHLNFKPGSPLHEWSYGFEQGMQLVLDLWYNLPFDDPELHRELSIFWLSISFFADEKRARELFKQLRELPKDEQDPKESPFFIGFVLQIRQDLPWQIKDYAILTQALFEANQAIQEVDPDWDPESSNDDIPQLSNLTPNRFQTDKLEARIRRARQQLNGNPDDIRALIELAQWDARNSGERIRYLEQAVDAGKRLLGEDSAQNPLTTTNRRSRHVTRDYLQALTELADAQRDHEQFQSAMKNYELALRISPQDHAGSRYALLTIYMQQQMHDAARTLLAQYPDDSSADFIFNRLLLDYIELGDNAKTRARRKRAKQYNPFIAEMLAGKMRLPEAPGEYYTPGDSNEAAFYLFDNQHLWKTVLGAIPWLQKI
jgi:uncharacterized protein